MGVDNRNKVKAEVTAKLESQGLRWANKLNQELS
jgi:hypothetical protein